MRLLARPPTSTSPLSSPNPPHHTATGRTAHDPRPAPVLPPAHEHSRLVLLGHPSSVSTSRIGSLITSPVAGIDGGRWAASILRLGACGTMSMAHGTCLSPQEMAKGWVKREDCGKTSPRPPRFCIAINADGRRRSVISYPLMPLSMVNRRLFVSWPLFADTAHLMPALFPLSRVTPTSFHRARR